MKNYKDRYQRKHSLTLCFNDEEFQQVEELAAIPGREGLLSMLLSVLQAPVRNFAYVVKAVAESKEESAE